MNFQQLRIIRETVRRDFNLTEVAANLYTSQSGVSKHIKDLESELGVELYVRKGKRLLGLTAPGQDILQFVERILTDTGNIRRVAEQHAREDSGTLTIATTHTQARYRLPEVVSAFKRRYPKVHLKLYQGSPDEIAHLLTNEEADIGIATESLGDLPELISFPYYHWHHAVLVPRGHPLTQVNPLTLAAIAEYPIITYQEGFTGRSRLEKSFRDADLDVDIVMSALDADVIKSYVELNLGIGIIASMAFNPVRDAGLQLLDSAHLFPSNTTWIAHRRGNVLRDFAYRFIEMCQPDMEPTALAR